MTQTRVPDSLIPLNAAAHLARMNRERLLRRVQDGVVPGQFIDGRWYVERAALAEIPGGPTTRIACNGAMAAA